VVVVGGAAPGGGGDAAGSLRPFAGCKLARLLHVLVGDVGSRAPASDGGLVGLLLRRSYPSLIRSYLHMCVADVLGIEDGGCLLPPAGRW
jgi:hypothetical protein